MFACFGDKIGMAKLVHGYSTSTSDGPNMSTKGEGKKSIKLKANEIVLQVGNLTKRFNFLLTWLYCIYKLLV